MKYAYTFTSHNDPNESFTLTFECNNSAKVPLLTNPEVYQHRGDMFCHITRHQNKFVPAHFSVTVEAVYSPFRFGIEIFIKPTGCEVVIVEKVVTTIVHEANLQPCNPPDSY